MTTAVKNVDWIPNPLEEFEVKKRLDMAMRRRNEIEIAQLSPSKNIGRLAQAIDPDHTDRLRACLHQGNPFYMPVLVEDPTTKELTVANGDHRVDMCRKEGIATIDAYVVSTDDKEKIFLLCNILNALNGNPPTTSERIQGALSYMENFRINAAEAAAQFKVGVSQINSALATEKGCNRAEKLGVPASITRRYKAAHWKHLNRIKQNDEVFQQAVRQFSHFDAAEIKTAVDNVLAKKNESAQLEAVGGAVRKQEHVHRREETPARETGSTPPPSRSAGSPGMSERAQKQLASRRKVARAIANLSDVLKDVDSVTKGGFTKQSEQDEIIKQAKAARRLLSRFIGSAND